MTTQTAQPYQGEAVHLHPGQSEAMRSAARFVGLIAGTGGGKSWFGPVWLYNEIAQWPGDDWMVIAPTYKILMRATVPMMQAFFRYAEYRARWRPSDSKFLLPCGGTIYCLSADNPNGLEGGQIRAAWLDEAGQMAYHVWLVLQARTGLKQGRILMTTTPYSVNWLASEVLARHEEGDEDYFVVQFPSVMNPAYPKAEFDRARRSMDRRIFEMRYCGKFHRMAGLVYPDFERALVKPYAVPEEWRRVGGVDFGFSQPFAIVFGAVKPDGTLVVYHEYKQPRQTISEHAAHMSSETQYWGDPSGAQFIEELRAEQVAILPAENDIATGVATVTEAILSKRLEVFTSCKHLIDEAAMYHYETDEQSLTAKTEKPVKGNDHLMDALRYLAMGLSSQNRWAAFFGEEDEEASGRDPRTLTREEVWGRRYPVVTVDEEGLDEDDDDLWEEF